MTPHIWYVIALIVFLAGAIIAATEKAWVLVLIAAGLACWLIPAAFELTS